MKIAITGATGQLGRLVVQQIKGRVPASRVVAIVRSPDKASDLGVEIREADYEDSAALDRSLTGIEKLLLISASEPGKRKHQHHNVIEAARKNGVQLIVYTSLLHADKSSLNLAEEHKATEDEIKQSGISNTILRNGWYTENYTGSIPAALAGGALLGSAGDARISSAAREDYADAAVAVLTSGGHSGETYELAGDEAYTLNELAAEISRQSGKDVPYRNLPESEYASILSGFGIPDPMARAIANWDTSASQGALFDDGRQLSRLIGHPTTPMSTSVAETIARIEKPVRAE